MRNTLCHSCEMFHYADKQGAYSFCSKGILLGADERKCGFYIAYGKPLKEGAIVEVIKDAKGRSIRCCKIV